jgi:epoxyqueuosine reductase
MNLELNNDLGREYFKKISDLAPELGLAALGVTNAEPFVETRNEIERRKEKDLHGGMQFTFRNPERSTTPKMIMPDAKSLIVGALRTPAPRLEKVAHEALRIAAYARKDYYSLLREALGVIAEILKKDGWKAQVVADENSLVDRAAAIRAGIGWHGKNGNVLIPGKGSWFVLGSIVTNAELPLSEKVQQDCGVCKRCIDGCPTGAIIEPGVVDARKCIAWLVQAPGIIPHEYRESIEHRIYGCDDCQEVCPEGREERIRERESDIDADHLAVEILEAKDEELLDRFGWWYIAERDPRYLKRNALISIGNSKEVENELFESLLRKYLLDPDPLLRSHAAWASIRLGHKELVDLAKNDSDPLVTNEIMLAEAEGFL